MPEVVSLTAAEVKQRLDREESLVLLDVREDVERAYCAIPVPPTALDRHVPMALVSSRFDELRTLAETAPLIVYCHHGVRSMAVAAWLARRGLSGVHNLEGGIDAWSVGVDPDLPRY